MLGHDSPWRPVLTGTIQIYQISPHKQKRNTSHPCLSTILGCTRKADHSTGVYSQGCLLNRLVYSPIVGEIPSCLMAFKWLTLHPSFSPSFFLRQRPTTTTKSPVAVEGLSARSAAVPLAHWQVADRGHPPVRSYRNPHRPAAQLGNPPVSNRCQPLYLKESSTLTSFSCLRITMSVNDPHLKIDV